jgi:ribosomal protein L44E
MTQHFSSNTVSASFYCGKCEKFTQHRIDDHRKGPCLECIKRLEEQHAEQFLEERKQQELFA